MANTIVAQGAPLPKPISKFGPQATVKIRTPTEVSAGEFLKVGRVKGFAVNDAFIGEEVVLVTQAEAKVDFTGTNAVEIGDVVEYVNGEFDKPDSPTDADAIVLEPHDASPGTIRVLLVPGLKL